MSSSGRPEPPPGVGGPTLSEVLGSRGGALDASVPPLAFVAGYALGAGPDAVAWGAGAAVAAGVLVAAVRLARGKRPTAVVLGVLGVVAAALVALGTGRAVDFFLLQLAGNAASALVWTVSIAVRWPLLGVIVGLALGQRTRWRRDPDLLRGYRRASWVWVGQYAVRLAVFVPLYLAEQVSLLAVARGALTYPLVAACVVLSWFVLRRALPDGHPGLLHPADPGRRDP